MQNVHTYHYVYKITNTNPTNEKIYYIGVRTSKKCLPENDTNYMSSSKSLKAVIKKLGKENFTKEILSMWNTRKEAVSEEVRLHEYFDVGRNPIFYNKAKQTCTGFDTSGITLSDERKKQISEFFKGRLDSEETKRKKSESLKGRKLSIETKKKLSEAHIGKESWCKGKKCPQFCGKNNSFYGKMHSDETKKIISEKSIEQWINFSEEEKKRIGKLKSETTIKNGSQKGKNNPASKIYRVISPFGEETICEGNLKTFCKINKLYCTCMYGIAKGITPKTKNSKHYGWIVEEITN